MIFRSIKVYSIASLTCWQYTFLDVRIKRPKCGNYRHIFQNLYLMCMYLLKSTMNLMMLSQRRQSHEIFICELSIDSYSLVYFQFEKHWMWCHKTCKLKISEFFSHLSITLDKINWLESSTKSFFDRIAKNLCRKVSIFNAIQNIQTFGGIK